jgi:hypothetical protein
VALRLVQPAGDANLLEAARHCEAAAYAIGAAREAHLVEIRRLLGWTKRAGPRKQPAAASINELTLRDHDAGDSVAKLSRRDGVSKDAIRQRLRRARRAREHA